MTTFSIPTFDNALWVAGLAGHSTLLTILIVRRCVKEFPIFTSRIAFQILETATLFLITFQANHQIAYFRAYWLFALGDYILQVALIFELARHVLRPTGTWISDARNNFLIWSLVGVLIAVTVGIGITPPRRTGLDLWSIRSSIATSILTCEIFVAMAVSANRLGLQWKSHVMAIGEGLAGWALIALAEELLHAAMGWRGDTPIFDRIRTSTYAISLLYWIWAFTQSEPQRAPLSPDMQDYLTTLHKRVLNDLDRIAVHKKRDTP